MENLSFESLRHKVSLNKKFRNKFLDQFPEEIQRQIIASTSNACLIELYDLQRQIIASHRMLDLPLCQYDPDFDNNPSRPVLAQVDLDATPASEEFISKLFFSGFLRQIKCDEPPEFFGPTICLVIQQYKKHVWPIQMTCPPMFIHIFSEHPSMSGLDYHPAKHHIIVMFESRPSAFYRREIWTSDRPIISNELFNAFPGDFDKPIMILEKTKIITCRIQQRRHPLCSEQLLGGQDDPEPFDYSEHYDLIDEN
ncbi:hypothetical protein RIF29_05796 [Crotalaria pallida]|uniref:Uncharacterized protein n=1 Tax=Crotalaria pallida TaxID=3830 RepID=A0AAN9PAI1_CROPI